MQQEQKILRGIYIIKCDVTGDSYIGCSSDICKRWQQHITDLTLGNKIPNFQLLVQKYGIKSLSFKVLEQNDTFTTDELLKLEASYILDLKPSLNTSIPKVIDSTTTLNTNETWKEREFNRIWNGLKFTRQDRRGIITIDMFYAGYVNKTKYVSKWKLLNKLSEMKLTKKVQLSEKEFCNYVISNVSGIKLYNVPVDSKDGKRYIFIYIDENSIQKLLKLL